MTVKRIVTNISTEHLDQAKGFYSEILGLKLVMNHGWILTFAGEGNATPQISIASGGGSGTPTPDISIEVDNFEEIYQRIVEREIAVEYGPVNEPWGVRRIYVRDPFGRLLNILTHEDFE